MKKQMVKVIPIVPETYIHVINNSVGSKIFRNLIARIGKKKVDITENGNLSCAYFVSSVLYMFDLIDTIHATVTGTVDDLLKSGWEKIDQPKVGAVIVWSAIDFGKNIKHKHIGFYVGKDTAISNDHKLGYPKKHNFQFNGKRQIEMILHNPKIASS